MPFWKSAKIELGNRGKQDIKLVDRTHVISNGRFGIAKWGRIEEFFGVINYLYAPVDGATAFIRGACIGKGT
jgi:hypothetical protein